MFGKRKDQQGFDIEFTDEDISSIHVEHSSCGLSLDQYSLDDIHAKLEALGVFAKLRRRGHEDMTIELDVSDPFVHKMVWRIPSAPEPLCECALRLINSTSMLHAVRPSPVIGLGAVVLKAWEGRLGESQPLKLLLVDWLLLQDPLAPVGEVLLPGQHMPGLGVGIEIGNMLHEMAHECACDAVVNRPLHFHNAVMYAPTNNLFLNPQVEARFRVLVRDLESAVLKRSLADVSHTIQCGSLRLTSPSTSLLQPVVTWTPEEQARAVSDRMESFFASDPYVSLVRRDSHGTSHSQHLTAAFNMLKNGRRVSLSRSLSGDRAHANSQSPACGSTPNGEAGLQPPGHSPEDSPENSPDRAEHFPASHEGALPSPPASAGNALAGARGMAMPPEGTAGPNGGSGEKSAGSGSDRCETASNGAGSNGGDNVVAERACGKREGDVHFEMDWLEDVESQEEIKAKVAKGTPLWEVPL